MNRFENIPPEMKSLKQWVLVSRDSKVPMNPNSGFSASSSNPGTWGSFDICRGLVGMGEADNIGFVFHDNGLVGIDIDTGWDADGLLSPECADILKHCRSYTEKSRSGRGFHVILKGELPFKGKNNQQGVEIYRTGRYFITTGDVLLFRDIVENQEVIDYVVETYFADTTKEGEEKTRSPRVYSPEWELPQNGRVKLRPAYPAIPQGCRNLSMCSLAGAMHTVGYSPEQIYRELCYANRTACQPVLHESEIEGIVRSITRYERD